MKQVHKVKHTRSVKDYSVISNHKCNYCDIYLDTDIAFVNHLIKEHPSSDFPSLLYKQRNIFKCPDCPAQFIKLHRYYKHSGGLAVNTKFTRQKAVPKCPNMVITPITSVVPEIVGNPRNPGSPGNPRNAGNKKKIHEGKKKEKNRSYEPVHQANKTQCPICRGYFSRKTDLKQHIETVHEGKRAQCSQRLVFASNHNSNTSTLWKSPVFDNACKK